MRFSDEGHIINLRRHGESSLILSVLTRKHGRVVGFVKNCLHKKNLAVYQLGNSIKIDAYSRVDDNMLSLKVELISPDAVNFIQDDKKISTLASFCTLCCHCLPELENLEEFYMRVDDFFKFINEDNWLVYYSYFEFYLLEYLGIGLDLRECAVTGTTENLTYVSPKSGRSVCAQVGEAYREKLFLYPHFVIQEDKQPNCRNLVDLLNMTGFFLRKNFFENHGLKFPENRANLLENLELNG